MRVRAGEIQSLATAIVDALQKQGLVHFKRDPAAACQRIVELIARNLEDEQALEEEAERLADAHAGKMVGMDHHRIVQGIKERLARERHFPL